MADVSVIIPCHNAADYVGQAIESVINQTDPPTQVIVVDDGSEDDTAKVVRCYADRPDQDPGATQVELIRQKTKSGVSKARNVAIDAARGQYVAFLDADDLWLPSKTAKQVAILDAQPDAVGAHCRVFNFHHRIDDLGRQETELAKDDPTAQELIMHHWVTTSTAVVRRSALDRFQFDETTGHAEDMILFADLRTIGRWRMVDELLVAKRIHPTQATGSSWHRIWAVETRVKWCRERASVIGEDVAGEAEQQMTDKLVGQLEAAYWKRQLDDLDEMRRYVADKFPNAMGKSFLAHTRIYPRWVYRVKDAVTRST